MQEKANGLHGGTEFFERVEGRDKISFHQHPATGELVIMRTWCVPNGEDDIDYEFEVEDVASKEVCERVKQIVEEMKGLKEDIKKI